MQLSQKQKTFFQFFLAFLKSILNFKHLAKRDDPHSLCISGNTGAEKPCFRGPLDRQYGKWVETL